MPRVKPPRKRPKHSSKAAYSHVRRVSKKLLVAWCIGMREPRFFSLEGKPVLVTDSIKSAMMTIAFPWSSLCITLCRDQLNQRYLKTLPIHSNISYPYATLSNTLWDHHAELVESCNRQHLVNVGWVASPDNQEVSDQIADRIMDTLDAWNFKARWEMSPDEIEEAEARSSDE